MTPSPGTIVRKGRRFCAPCEDGFVNGQCSHFEPREFYCAEQGIYRDEQGFAASRRELPAAQSDLDLICVDHDSFGMLADEF
jgi:hypothetical protein